jgi:hypothetical protein
VIRVIRVIWMIGAIGVGMICGVIRITSWGLLKFLELLWISKIIRFRVSMAYYG